MRGLGAIRASLTRVALLVAVVLFGVLCVGCLGCDQGHQDDETNTGAAVTVTLAGGSSVPSNGSVVLQFNRFLNPETVNRQTIQLVTAGGSSFVDPIFDYDPVLMTATLSNPGGAATWLTSGQTYEVQLPAATAMTAGVLAIDNATLAVPMTKLAFNAGAPGAVVTPPTMHFCVDILPIFLSKCSAPSCHGSPGMETPNPRFPDGGTFPAAGLVLDNSQGVADTAIGRVAHGSNYGPNAGTPSSPPCRSTADCLFGVDMPLIDPGSNGSGDPGNSWLVYKLLLSIPPPKDDDLVAQCNPFQTAESYHAGLSPLITTSAGSAERATLSNYILGREMPYPSYPATPEGQPAASTTPLSVQELERMVLWIKQGAELENVLVPGEDGGFMSVGSNCSACTMLPSDGGTPPPMDAGSDSSPDSPTDASGDASSDATPKG